MANDNTIKSFTALDIEKYHKGLLSHAEMHSLEKAALDDPFLADALDGYAVEGVHVNEDIAELKKRLAPKTETAKVVPMSNTTGSSFPWLRAAVVVVLIAGAGLLSYQFFFQQKAEDSVAIIKDKNKTENNERALAPSKSGDAVENKKAEINPGQLTIQPANTDTSSLIAKQDNSRKDLSANNNTARVEDYKIKTIDQSNKTQRSGMDSVGFKRNIETKPPIANAPTNTQLEKSLQGRVAGVDVTTAKGDVKPADDFAKSKIAPTQKPSANPDRDGDGIADKFAGKEEKLNEVVVTGYGAQRNDIASRKQVVPNSMYTYRGRIVDANNNSLPFANITNTTDNVGTRTDAKGNYSMISTDSVLNVQVRALGFENNTVQLRSGTKEDQIVMSEDRSIAAKVIDTSRQARPSPRNGSLTFEEPEPADGWPAYNSYVANNLNMPDNIDRKKTGEGDAVEVSFEVNKYGEPVNIKVEKSLCDKCDKEAIRLIKEGPKWKRKARKGRTTVSIPFNQ